MPTNLALRETSVNSASQIYIRSGLLFHSRMNDIDEIRRENIRLLEHEAGSAKEAADAVGMTLSQYSNLRDGAADSKTGKPRGMRQETAWRFDDAFGRPRGWLNEKHGPREEKEPAPRQTEKSGDEFSIPRYSVKARGGAGQLVPYEYIVGHISVTHDWLKTVLPAITSKSNLRVIEAYGRSMEPTIHEGDLLIVDTGVTRPDRDDVYIIQRNNTPEPELMVKRVQRKVDGGIVLRSDNSALYEPEAITAKQLQGIQVLGRVIWIWAGRRP